MCAKSDLLRIFTFVLFHLLNLCVLLVIYACYFFSPKWYLNMGDGQGKTFFVNWLLLLFEHIFCLHLGWQFRNVEFEWLSKCNNHTFICTKVARTYIELSKWRAVERLVIKFLSILHKSCQLEHILNSL